MKPTTEIATRNEATMAELDHLAESAHGFVAAAKAGNTRKAYERAWIAFGAWCEAKSIPSLPAPNVAVAMHATALAEAGRSVSTIEQAMAAITAAHKAAGHPNPRDSREVSSVLAGIRRTLGTAANQKAPVLVADLRRMAATLPEGAKGVRDRALLLVGFAGAFRRSELVAVDFEDLTFGDEGITIAIRRSKTDQEGEGRNVAIPFGSDPGTCPVRSLKVWIELASITEGAVFRSVTKGGKVNGKRLSPRDVARVVKTAAKATGLDSSRFSGHSLRAGLATSAAKAGKSERSIMKTTGHRSSAMVRRYIRDANLFEDCAAAGIGL